MKRSDLNPCFSLTRKQLSEIQWKKRQHPVVHPGRVNHLPSASQRDNRDVTSACEYDHPIQLLSVISDIHFINVHGFHKYCCFCSQDDGRVVNPVEEVLSHHADLRNEDTT